MTSTLPLLLSVLFACCALLPLTGASPHPRISHTNADVIAPDSPATVAAPVRYNDTWESLDSRPLPEWFDDAKFGQSSPAHHSDPALHSTAVVLTSAVFVVCWMRWLCRYFHSLGSVLSACVESCRTVRGVVLGASAHAG